MDQLVSAGEVMSAVGRAPQPRGDYFDIGGGRRMRAVRAGAADASGPLVLLEAGAFGLSADWAVVQEKLAAAGLRSLAYDRAGLGFSDPGPEPRDSQAIVEDLEHLLQAAGETGPLLLVGHSMAGLHLRLFAARQRRRLVGVVLVDATTPEAMASPVTARLVGHFGQISRLAAWGAGVGLFKPLADGLADSIGLAEPARAEKRWAFAAADHNRWAAAEAVQWPNDAVQAQAAGAFDPDLPLGVVLTGRREDSSRRVGQIAPAMASRGGFVDFVPGSNHASLLGLRYADHIVRAILKVRDAAPPHAVAAE